MLFNISLGLYHWQWLTYVPCMYVKSHGRPESLERAPSILQAKRKSARKRPVILGGSRRAGCVRRCFKIKKKGGGGLAIILEWPMAIVNIKITLNTTFGILFY